MGFETFFIPSFGKRSGAHHHGGFRPEQYLPPMAPGPGQVNFDYSPLFIAKSLVLDRHAFEVLISTESPLPPKALEQLKALHDEGFIDLTDYTLSAEEGAAVREATEAELHKGDVWDLSVTRSINWWLNAKRHFGPEYDAHMHQLGSLPYLLTEYQASKGIYYDVGLGRSFWHSVKRAKKSNDPWYAEVMHELRSYLLDYVNTNLVVAGRLSSANYEWHNYQPALSQKLKSSDPGTGASSPLHYAPRALVEAVIPFDFPLARTRSAIKLLKDRRIRNVREVLSQAVEYHGGVNDALRRDFYHAMCEAEHISARRRKFGYFTAPLGIALGLPGMGTVADAGGRWLAGQISGNTDIVTDLLKEGAEMAAAELVDQAASIQKPSRQKLTKATMIIHKHYRGNRDKLL